MKRGVVIVAALLVVAAALFAVDRVAWPNRAIVRNSSGSAIRDVTLRLESLDGGWSLDRRVATMGPGESIVIRHAHNDTRAELTFVLAGARCVHSEPHNDLWRGEGWVFDIQSDGGVKTGYDHARARRD